MVILQVVAHYPTWSAVASITEFGTVICVDQGCERISSIFATFRWLQQLVADLQSSAGWKPSHMHLFGFSQGGSAALHLALHSRYEPSFNLTV